MRKLARRRASSLQTTPHALLKHLQEALRRKRAIKIEFLAGARSSAR